MSALATILAQLAVSILQWVASREDLKQTVYDKVDRAAAERAMVALGWLAASADAPDRGSWLRDRAGHLEFPGGDSAARGPSDPGKLPPQR